MLLYDGLQSNALGCNYYMRLRHWGCHKCYKWIIRLPTIRSVVTHNVMVELEMKSQKPFNLEYLTQRWNGKYVAIVLQLTHGWLIHKNGGFCNNLKGQASLGRGSVPPPLPPDRGPKLVFTHQELNENHFSIEFVPLKTLEAAAEFRLFCSFIIFSIS